MKKSLRKLLAMAAMGFVAFSASAVMPEAGKVYKIVNKSYGTAVADQGPTGKVGCQAFNENNSAQRWLVSAGAGNSLRFKSLGTGCYLTSSRARSTAWSVSSNSSTAAAQLAVSGSDGNYVVRTSGDPASLSMHCDGQGVVVCWSDDIDPSKWDFVEIPMTQQEIDEALQSFQRFEDEINKTSTYAAALAALYQDAACTTLKSNYQSMTDANIQADSNYKALSPALQQMVLKTKNGNWAETCSYNGKSYDWDSDHAKKYRVQLYEPYSEGEAAAVMAGIQAYTNVNNPTGILGNAGDILYVMVDGEIKDGASLYLTPMTGAGMFNNVREGVELHSGLNVVPVYSEQAHQLMNYTIYTTQTVNGRNLPVKGRELSNYPDLKIHIEGGQLNGFFNAQGDALYAGDTRADYDYTSERATFQMYNLIGKYVILHLFLEDTKANVDATNLSWGLKSVLNPEKNIPGANTRYCFDPVVIMKAWDDMCFRERTLMGIQRNEELLKYNEELLWGYYEPLTGDKIDVHPAGDTYDVDPGFEYGDYFNNRMMGITMQGNLYMNATWWRTAYNISTLTSILCELPYYSGPIWGPAHEYGHMNQGPMKMAGTTEESNNIFSNVAVYYAGHTTSRADMPVDQLKCFNKDGFYLENDVWGTTRMFLQLWIYYHACGNNKKFYPRLYELLRKNPLEHSYYLNVRKDHLQFVRMACLAAQEDLTDFFDSWGFFVPLDNYHIGDYANYYATLTQKDIDEVKAEIKSWNLPKNDQIILIDDRPGSKRESWADYMAISQAGVLGGIEDFRNKRKATGTFSCTMRNDSLIIDASKGTAGVGFLVYGEDGKLLSFTNDYKCPLKKTATAALMQGKAKVYAISADGSRIEVSNEYRNAPVSEHLSNLHKLMESTADVHDVIDENEVRVGWYIPKYAKAYMAAYDAAAAANESNSIDEITDLYLKLLEEYNAIKATTHTKVQFVNSSIYKIYNYRFPTHVLASTSSKASCVAAKTEGDEYQQWKVSTKDNGYIFYNMRWEKYLGKPDNTDNDKKVLNMVASRNDAGVFEIREDGPGKYLLLNGGEWNKAVHQFGDKAGGTLAMENGGWDASHWYIEIKEANELYKAKADLGRMITEAEALLEEAGKIGIEGDEIVLTPEMLYSNAPMRSGDDRFTGFDVLFDQNLLTYFHTNTDNDIDSDDGLDHYIRVDLGENNQVSSFQINWSNRDVLGGGQDEEEQSPSVPVNQPGRIQVDGSNDGVSYTTITTLSALPTGNAKSYTSPLITDGNVYRYIRLMNVYGAKKAHGHAYFALAELGMAESEERARPKECYPKVTSEMMFDLRDELANANKSYAKATTKADVYLKAIADLEVPFNILAAAMGVEGSINEVEANIQAASATGIYDLSGRRVAKPAAGHIYIIDGKKILVK
ncbi:MAG: M60 family metallopeptidase [Muribaculaceae bacterium]|nr:M60 family metallopeptidase [Muribaculaceae bacterium]